ncbi:MAG: FAD-dependent oxidoreductase [Rhodothermales bacterium]
MFDRKKPEVLIVGAGPIGLFAALVLAKRGIRVQVVDKDWRPAAHSYGLALHAHALDLFEEVGLLGRILERAYRVRTIGFYDGASRRAEMHISDLGEDFSFLAVMTQDVLENLLEDELRHCGVKVLWNHQVSQLVPREDYVSVTIGRLEKESMGYAVAHMEWFVAKSTVLKVPFVIGADGHLSDTRRALQIDFPDLGGTQHFAVFEFKTDADLQHEMRVVMDDRTTNVLWPLPDGYCRWSFELDDYEVPASTRSKGDLLVELGTARFSMLTEDNLRALIAKRAPWFTGSIERLRWRIVVRFERRLASAFGRGRTWLAGDAGHVTGPVGVQSMNVGFHEAHNLAGIIADVLQGQTSPERLHTYNEERLAEWRYLLGLDGTLKAGAQADPWIRRHSERFLPCIPASGEDFVRLARQVGIDPSGLDSAKRRNVATPEGHLLH